MRVKKQKPPEIAQVFSRIPAATLAAQLGITAQSVAQWKRIPADRIIEVERISGISRQQLRPDLAEIFAPDISSIHYAK